MKKFLGEEHLNRAVKSLLLKISSDGSLKVEKSSISAELSEGVKVAEIAGISIYAPEGVSEEVFNQIRSEIGKAVGSVEVKDHITFSCQEPFSIYIANTEKYWNGTLEYSTDLVNWTEWDPFKNNNTVNSSSGSSPYCLYVRGSNNTIITGDQANSYRGYWAIVSNGYPVKCTGNIETLLDYKTVLNGQHPSMNAYCFYYMFCNCTSLVSAPELPAAVLNNYCYSRMFQNCTHLVAPPELPATSLAQSCYNYMFRDCTSLTSLPLLPAVTLPSYCYQYMFQNCSSIKLSATKTEEYQTPYRIPSSGTGSTGTNSLQYMFTGTGGTFTGGPTINTNYYLHSSNKVVPEGTGGTSTPDWNDIQNKPSFATVATSGSYNDLSNKPTIPAAQVNSDWNSASGVSQILNKPTIPAEGTVVPILTSGIPIAVIDGVTIYAPDPNAT